MSHIFFCHAFADRVGASNEIDAIVGQLRDLGMEVWIAPDSIAPGEHHASEISKAIQTARAIVLVLSESANASRDVLNEIALAQSKAREIVVVRLREDLTPSNGLDYYVHAIRPWIEWWEEAAFPDSLVQRLLPKRRSNRPTLVEDDEHTVEVGPRLGNYRDFEGIAEYGGVRISIEHEYFGWVKILVDGDELCAGVNFESDDDVIDLTGEYERSSEVVEMALCQGHHVITAIAVCDYTERFGASIEVFIAEQEEKKLRLIVNKDPDYEFGLLVRFITDKPLVQAS